MMTRGVQGTFFVFPYAVIRNAQVGFNAKAITTKRTKNTKRFSSIRTGVSS